MLLKATELMLQEQVRFHRASVPRKTSILAKKRSPSLRPNTSGSTTRMRTSSRRFSKD